MRLIKTPLKDIKKIKMSVNNQKQPDVHNIIQFKAYQFQDKQHVDEQKQQFIKLQFFILVLL